MKISPLVKRTVSVLLAVSLAVGMTVPTGTTAFADDRRQELQDKVDEQQDKLDAINQQIADNAAERENAKSLTQRRAAPPVRRETRTPLRYVCVAGGLRRQTGKRELRCATFA